MSDQNTDGSLQQMALPAEGGCKGGSDSRSETLSPREWPTLEADLEYWKWVRDDARIWGAKEFAKTAEEKVKAIEAILDSRRRRRPRGESENKISHAAESERGNKRKVEP